MRDDLIEQLRGASSILMMRDAQSTSYINGCLMAEAADELEKFQKESIAHRTSWLRPNSVFLSGDVAKQIAEQNKEREAQGLPPL